MTRFVLYFLILLCFAPAALVSQRPEATRHLTGSLVFGWMETTARESFEERRRNPFTTLRMDFQSYLLDPDILTFRVQPRVSSGFQDAFTGMSDGSGLAFESIFLPHRPWPLRFHFSRFRRSLLTTGAGSSSFAHFAARNNDSTLGLEWQYMVPNRPSLTLTFDKVATATTPETILAQGFDTRSRTLSLTSRDVRWGWSMYGGLTYQRQNIDYLFGAGHSEVVLNNKSNIGNLTYTAQRPVGESLDILFSANHTANRSDFDRGRFDQTFNSWTGKVSYKPGRFQGWTQLRGTRSELESVTSGLPGQAAFTLPSVQISNSILDSEARYQLHPYLSVFGRSQFTRVSAPGIGQTQRAGNFLNAGTGLQFSRSKKSLVLGGSYFVYTTLTRFQRDSSGNLLGHALDASVSAGDPSVVRVSGLFSLNRSREDVRTLLFVHSRSERVQLVVAKTLFQRWTVEIRGGLSKISYTRPEFRSDFVNKEYGASLSGPRFHLGYSRSVGAGDSLQRLLGLSTIAPTDLALPGLLVIGSSNSNTVFDASLNLASNLSLRGIWRGQVQSLGSTLTSRFEEQEATLNWLFRRVRAEVGYLVYRFDFGSPIFRKSIIVRVTRDFQVF